MKYIRRPDLQSTQFYLSLWIIYFEHSRLFHWYIFHLLAHTILHWRWNDIRIQTDRYTYIFHDEGHTHSHLRNTRDAQPSIFYTSETWKRSAAPRKPLVTLKTFPKFGKKVPANRIFAWKPAKKFKQLMWPCGPRVGHLCPIQNPHTNNQM